jgi:hypothetical protein
MDDNKIELDDTPDYVTDINMGTRGFTKMTCRIVRCKDAFKIEIPKCPISDDMDGT